MMVDKAEPTVTRTQEGTGTPIEIEFEGKREQAIELDFETEKEGWAVFTLPDGTVIKLKNVVSRIYRLLNRVKDDGSPLYVLEGQAILTTIAPQKVEGDKAQ